MNYYIQGDAAKADKIKAAFSKFVSIQEMAECDFSQEEYLFYTGQEERGTFVYSTWVDGINANIIKTHPDYQELELPVEPMFKAEDRIVSKSDKSTIYRIITLHKERREYVVEIEHKDYHESCPWIALIAFEDQDDYELAPKPHYDIANFHTGMPVLVRPDNDCAWDYSVFSRITDNEYWKFSVCNGVSFTQCIPFNEKTKQMLGTADMPSEEFINW